MSLAMKYIFTLKSRLTNNVSYNSARSDEPRAAWLREKISNPNDVARWKVTRGERKLITGGS